MFKEPNALPIPPDAKVPGLGELSREEVEARVEGLLLQRTEVVRQLELLDQVIRFHLWYVCGPKDDTEDVEDYTPKLGVSAAFVAAAQRSIGQLRWRDNLANVFLPPDDPGTVSGVKWGSGALIAPNLFLTAGHCFDQAGGRWTRPSRNGQLISRSEIATYMDVVFNFQFVGGTHQKNTRPEAKFPVVALLEHCSQERTPGGIDYAIVELGRDANGRLPGDLFGTLTAAKADVTVPGTVLTIIQHPNQKEKRVGVGTLLGIQCGLLAYNDIDTGEGSSGAPVLDLNGQIVGVHVRGACLPDGGQNNAQRIGDIRFVSKKLP